MDFPEPSRLSSPKDIIFLSDPSMELILRDGQSSRISCLVNLPILFKVALRTISMAGSFSSMIENLSSKSLYAARIIPRKYFKKFLSKKG